MHDWVSHGIKPLLLTVTSGAAAALAAGEDNTLQVCGHHGNYQKIHPSGLCAASSSQLVIACLIDKMSRPGSAIGAIGSDGAATDASELVLAEGGDDISSGRYTLCSTEIQLDPSPRPPTKRHNYRQQQRLFVWAEVVPRFLVP